MPPHEVPVIVAVPGMDGFKERSLGLDADPRIQRGVGRAGHPGAGLLRGAGARHLRRRAGLGETRQSRTGSARGPRSMPGKIGMTGSSFGSFFTAIMMADEPRFKACGSAATGFMPRSSASGRRCGLVDEHEPRLGRQ